MTKTLDDRIADACTSETSSAELKALIEEVGLVDEKAKAESEAASKIAFDPAIRDAEVSAARKSMDDADFRSKRMSAAMERLSQRLQGAIDRETAAQQVKVRASAIAERDQLVEDLKEYAVMAPKIVALLERLASNNAKLGPFETAEIISRGLPESWATSFHSEAPPLLETIRLPKFTTDGTLHGYQWPPPNR